MMLKNTIAITIFFLYFYTISYWFLLFSSTVIFGIIGLVWFLLRLMLRKIPFRINKVLFRFLFLLLSIGAVAVVSLVINETSDLKFITYIFSQIAVLFASFFVIKILKNIGYKTDFENIIKLIINVIFFQSIIALSMFLFPEFKDFLLGIEKLSNKELEIINSYSEFRIYGLGSSKTFLAGVFNGYALILIAFLFRTYQVSLKELSLISFKFLFIFFVGMMMARTTIVGAIISVFIIFMPRDLKATLTMFRKRILFFTIVLCLPIVFVASLFLFFPAFDFLLGEALRFGFEMFLNFSNSGSFETESTEELLKLYIFPDNLKTYIIGDGYFADPVNIGKYYMATDVGYLRLIYYFGLVGLSCYLSMQIYLISKAFSLFSIGKGLYFFIVLYFLVLNLKGFTDLLFVHVVFVMAHLSNKNQDSKKITF